MAAVPPFVAGMIIDIHTDIICPWCYVGKRRLELALDSAPIPDVHVRYLPFELAPRTPPAGVDRAKYLKDKYGDGVKGSDARITALGREIGLDFQFEKIVKIPNTHDSHRIIWLAGKEAPDLQKGVVEALHQAYFTQGKDLGDSKTLVATAAGAGLEAGRVESLLAGSEGSEEVRALEKKGIDLGISGVPFFVFNDESAISGAQPVETFISVLQEQAG
jgi:predicted DsbA family dithiol-disulfide isomerase